jgi:hypothetical protein
MGGNPLIGKWSVDLEKTGGIGVMYASMQLEFTADEMWDGESVRKVKYEVDGKQISVKNEKGKQIFAITTIDHDHILLGVGFYKFTFRRMN